MDTVSIAELTQEYFYSSVNSYADMAALVYDTLLTLEDEVTLIWRKKFGLGSILYLLARYCIIAQTSIGYCSDIINYEGIGSLKSFHNENDKSNNIHNQAELGSAISIHSLLIGRAYAVSGGKLYVAAGLGLILASSIGIAISSLLLETINAFNFSSVYLTLVSAILVCRFILQLRKFNARVQTVPSVNIASTPGIRGRLQHIHETIIEEFGNSGMEYDLEMENDMTELEGDTSASINSEVHITAEEFPWAINPVEDVAGPSEIRSRGRGVDEEV
ncbi:hypothetical protein M422DRAFT_259742 [Sphaerobolus stellatus SS14]|uniref:DUF6533 domain-containing protein n=1 Tax=Sphaerobolus stellatus (strain SS14) TaxID=990650 RepID=A0A0C9VJP7_SPHS4|nr:hypothetical protein M422DRAFT_259742 [Sphaerobolus stellatus SS14]